jgi:predicted amidohydrolase
VIIGLVQFYPEWENKKLNRSRINQLMEKQSTDVDMLVFPELTLTGFTMRSGRFAEKIDGESKDYFSSLADKFACHVIAGMIEEDSGKYFNTLIHIDPHGQLKCKYRKIHPFSYSGEEKHYAAGDEPVITEAIGMSIGLSICYDLRFPELYRQYAKKGVDIIIDIANWPTDRIEHWYTLLKARAIENQCYMIGVNRIGRGKSIDYAGWSSVFHPFGDELLCLKEIEKLGIIEVQTEEVTLTKSKYPFLKDIRLI